MAASGRKKRSGLPRSPDLPTSLSTGKAPILIRTVSLQVRYYFNNNDEQQYWVFKNFIVCESPNIYAATG